MHELPFQLAFQIRDKSRPLDDLALVALSRLFAQLLLDADFAFLPLVRRDNDDERDAVSVNGVPLRGSFRLDFVGVLRLL